ncbi:Transcriptional regulator PadR-like family protein [Planococcus massiliensis]|uniref:Transcriptional regulator PadR-like family protein n=1 Tax=Planococcus massiliensis TaxID=1499687 RepID=A0A098ER59_9BACL|nr:PadR family transcriptional regulator [Planococcus massiliensis]CEG23781.1 Transcriptional regulator PadR-like family protein [Planococcus massiliensis]
MQALSESTYLVLLALTKKPLHGYGIIKKIEKYSDGELVLAPGTLYGVLTNLQKQKLIELVAAEKESRQKKIYRLTTEGQAVVELEYLRFKKMLTISDEILKGAEDDEEI